MISALVIAGHSAAVLLGLLTVYWGYRFDRSRGRPRCPKCWYLMIGATGLRCPECGHTVASPAQFFATRRHWLLAVAGFALFLAGVLPLGARIYAYITTPPPPPKWLWTSDTAAAGFTVSLWRDSGFGIETHIEIKNAAGELVFAMNGGRVFLTNDYVINPTDPPYFARDMNGDGIPDLVLHEFTGGAHCCFTDYILSLDAKSGTVVEQTVLEGLHSPPLYRDIDGDGVLEVIQADWTFAYWPTTFVASPSPVVVLRYQSGRYVVDTDLMWDQPPTEEEFADLVAETRADEAWEAPNSTGIAERVPPQYYIEVLELIYSDHADLAWRFAKEAWGCDDEQRCEFLTDLVRQLESSPYWLELRPIVRLDLLDSCPQTE